MAKAKLHFLYLKGLNIAAVAHAQRHASHARGASRAKLLRRRTRVTRGYRRSF